ncbi:MAG: GTPase Era [Bacteroidales bacterium]|nr:GTPase Era [Bacteroidales bacterium]MBR3572659.1 GTPase Era [Bacteroidales bacterium]
MTIDQNNPIPADHRAGFVNLIGNPNVGKSTLMNQLVGEKISIMTSKAQTTRHRIKGIVNGDNFQIVYSDLPGVLDPAYMMQKMMMKFVVDSLQDADIILYLVECGETKYNAELVEKIKLLGRPIVLIINKIDKFSTEQVEESKAHWQEIFPDADVFAISALKGLNIDALRERIVSLLPLCPPYFPKDALTDRPMRFFVSELIREQILLQYKKEIPYSVEVVVDSYKEDENLIRIGATLYVERDTQKAIIIGSKGSAIKKLGTDARTSIEDFLQKHVFLDLSVKVLKDWRNSELLMKKFGYDYGE